MITDLIQSLKTHRQKAIELYHEKKHPSSFFIPYVAAVDDFLRALWNQLVQDESMVLLATGGYGRSELYPYSDLDLALISEQPLSELQQEKTAAFVQALWDAQLFPALKSGSMEELCAQVREDITGDTAFLEARFLCGDHTLAQATLQQMNKQRDIAGFIEAKCLEMRQRHTKSQGSGAVLEPNIKSCPGGLRDIHTMLWIAKAQGLDTNPSALIRQGILTRTEAGMLMHCHRKLSSIRIQLHLCANRAEDRLLFDLQAELADAIGIQGDNRHRSEELMRIFYRASKTVKQLNGILIPMLQARINPPKQNNIHRIDADYYQSGNNIAAYDMQLFNRDPSHIFRLLALWQQRRDITSLEPQTLRAWWAATRRINLRFYQQETNRRLFLELFLYGTGLTHIMRFLNLYGVLGRYLPAWEKIVGLLQHDLFHIYPVDEHILTVLRNTRRFAIDAHSHEMPLASSIMQSSDKQHIQYLAALFHDIAKGRQGDHAKEGVADALQFAADHFLTQEEGTLLGWLVENHLLMSAVAQKEDTQDPDVIAAFCEKVQTQERLNALYLLTVADIRGTNPKLWNSWRASLLENLFQTASAYFAGKGGNRSTIFNQRQQRASEMLARTGTPDKLQQRLWRVLGSGYFVRHREREVLWHCANLVHDTEVPQVRSRILPENDAFQVMIFMPNGPRLFARLCRIFSIHGFNILAARAFITEHNYILDTFIVQIPPHHHTTDYPNIQSELEAELNSFIHGYALEHSSLPQQRRSRRSRFSTLSPSVMLTQDEDDWFTVEITAANRSFLLADIAEVFFAHNVSIRYAKIATLDERVEDSFIVYSPELANPKNQSTLKQALLEQLNR